MCRGFLYFCGMSLNVILLKKCPPEEATEAFPLRWYEGLQALQPTGMLCMKQVGPPVGHNCMSKAWHHAFDADDHDPVLEVPTHFFRENWQDILPWLASPNELATPPPDGWDVMYIEW